MWKDEVNIGFGVWRAVRLGVAPSKLVSYIGVFSPPFKGVSTSRRANKVWASYTKVTSAINTMCTCINESLEAAGVRGVIDPGNELTPGVKLYSANKCWDDNTLVSTTIDLAFSDASPSLTTSSNSKSETWGDGSTNLLRFLNES